MTFQKAVLLLALYLSLQSTALAKPLSVLVTFAPLSALAQAIVGQTTSVQLLVPPKSAIHDYQARPGDVLKLRQADVLICNGFGLEAFLEPLMTTAEALTTITTSAGLTPLQPLNPHIWLDPQSLSHQLEVITTGLKRYDPTQQTLYQRHSLNYLQQLAQLDYRYRATLTPLSAQLFLTLDPAFAYLAHNYGLQQVVLLPLGEEQLTPQRLRQVIDIIRQQHIRTLFAPLGLESGLLTILRQDLGIKIQFLDTLETHLVTPDSLLLALRQNLAVIKAGLTPPAAKLT